MVFEWGLFAILGATLFWGIGDFLMQRSVRKIGSLEGLALLGVIESIILLPLALPQLFLLFLPENMQLLCFLGVTTFITAFILFQALRKGKLAVVEVLCEFELPLTIILGTFLLSDFLSFNQLLFMVPIFVGIILIAFEPRTKLKHLFKLEHGALLALIAAFGMAFVNSFVALSSRVVSPVMAIWFPHVIIALLALVFLFIKKRIHKTELDFAKFHWLIIVTSLFEAVAWLLFAFSTSIANVGVVTAITESYPAIGIILGVMVNKEKISRRQAFGAFLAIISGIALGATLI